ncbi:MFS transporter [Flavihumibacter rivuli]|uniref:MFS transporter n=1 Tax=Flavihumibacter rivuli TaxID=2838156 RepID=UPI001BDED2E6|nr:MFS transporter [Flavihumibacter rivuli]ULQ57322.1 MFS transporter [Flavihumibacter rivuli]
MFSQTISAYKNAYLGLSRSTWLLSLIMLINRSGTMVVPFLTLYLTSPKMGYSIGQAGLVMGCFGAGAFLGAYVGGKLTDRIGFYKVQLITLLGGGLLFILLGQMKSYPMICLVTFILSFVNEAFRPANSTAVVYYSSVENRTRSYSLNRLAINLGWALGSAMGGILAKFDYHLLFWVDGITNISAALLMLRFLRPKADHIPSRNENANRQKEHKGSSAFRDRQYLLFILLVTVFAACFFQLFTNLSVYMKRELHFSEPFIGLLMALNGVIIVLVEMVMIYNLEGKRNQLTYITLGVLIVACFYLLHGMVRSGPLLMVMLIVLVTFGEMFAMPFMNSYWISRTQHHNRGEYAALYTMAWSAAQTVGPMTVAQLIDARGFAFTWVVVGLVCSMAGIAFWRMKASGPVADT